MAKIQADIRLENEGKVQGRNQGFSLLELLIASGLGVSIVILVINNLFAEGALGMRLSRTMRERQALGRVNGLIKGDLERGKTVQIDPNESSLILSCPLAGRKPVLHIRDAEGRITSYSVGKSTEAIWRGWVLMRCGRAFRIDGSLNNGAAFQNRVVIDGLDPSPQLWQGCELPQGLAIGDSAFLPLAACLEPLSGTVQWQLRQKFENQKIKLDGSAVIDQ
jgi:hypothetical protein